MFNLSVDVWEDEASHSPVVYHGHTRTGKLPLAKALTAINEYAFEVSKYVQRCFGCAQI